MLISHHYYSYRYSIGTCRAEAVDFLLLLVMKSGLCVRLPLQGSLRSRLRFLMSLLRSAMSMDTSFSRASMSALPTLESFFFSSSRNTRSIRVS